MELTTLEDVLYVNVKNDVSCLIDDTMSLFEHQSTVNPNIPCSACSALQSFTERSIMTT